MIYLSNMMSESIHIYSRLLTNYIVGKNAEKKIHQELVLLVGNSGLHFKKVLSSKNTFGLLKTIVNEGRNRGIILGCFNVSTKWPSWMICNNWAIGCGEDKTIYSIFCDESSLRLLCWLQFAYTNLVTARFEK